MTMYTKYPSLYPKNCDYRLNEYGDVKKYFEYWHLCATGFMKFVEMGSVQNPDIRALPDKIPEEWRRTRIS